MTDRETPNVRYERETSEGRLGFSDREVDYWTTAIERQHPGWRVDQTYRTEGWGLMVYDESRLVGEYHRGHVDSLRHLAGLDESEGRGR